MLLKKSRTPARRCRCRHRCCSCSCSQTAAIPSAISHRPSIDNHPGPHSRPSLGISGSSRAVAQHPPASGPAHGAFASPFPTRCVVTLFLSSSLRCACPPASRSPHGITGQQAGQWASEKLVQRSVGQRHWSLNLCLISTAHNRVLPAHIDYPACDKGGGSSLAVHCPVDEGFPEAASWS